MIAIAKDKIFNLNYEEVSKKKNKAENIFKENKVVKFLLGLLTVFSIINAVLIYNFFSILSLC